MKVFPNLPSGDPHTKEIPREIARAIWSMKGPVIEKEWNGKPALFAWKGDTVALIVETRWVKDGTPVKLTIHEKGDESKKFDEVSGTISKCQFIKDDYKLSWDGKELEKKETPIVFKVEIEKFKLEAESMILILAKDVFAFSR